MAVLNNNATCRSAGVVSPRPVFDSTSVTLSMNEPRETTSFR